MGNSCCKPNPNKPCIKIDIECDDNNVTCCIKKNNKSKKKKHIKKVTV